MGKRKTKEEFIKDAIKIHNNKYDYSLVKYKNNKTKVNIICREHGIFEQRPDNHIKGAGCPICKNNKTSIRCKKSTDKFIKDSKEIHHNKYDYSLVKYKNNKTKVNIICREHGIFEQTPNSHLNGKGCPKCVTNYKLNNNTFINKSKEIHGDKYDYSLINYKKSNTKIKIICPEHGIFEQIPNSHLNGNGCPKCRESKGERKIRQILEQKNIKFETQKTFDGCKYKQKLKFDFYLPDYNICIEYDGEQHYKPKEYFGGNKEFDKIIKRDNIKNNYCKENNIKLIRIKYNQNIKNLYLKKGN